MLIAGKPTGAFGKFKLEPGMTLLPVPYTEALEQDYLPTKLTNDDYPNLIPKGSTLDTIAIASVLAVYNWPRDTDRYRRVAKFIDAFFTKFPEFQQPAAPRQMEGSQHHGHLARLETVSRGGGMARKESRQAGRRRTRRRSIRPSCARRRPRPRPTIRPSRSACSSNSWSGRRRKSARPRGGRCPRGRASRPIEGGRKRRERGADR